MPPPPGRRRQELVQSLLERIMTWSHTDIRLLEQALEERQTAGTSVDLIDHDGPSTQAVQQRRSQVIGLLREELHRINTELASIGANAQDSDRQAHEEEPSVEERGLREQLQQLQTRREEAFAEAHRTMTQTRELMRQARARQAALEYVAQHPPNNPSVEGEGEEEQEEYTIEEEEEEEYDSSSWDTESGIEWEEDADNEWYYRRAREMQEEDDERGVPIEVYRRTRREQTVEELREKMNQLEEDMENAKIDEGTYIERADELRDAYRDAKHVHTRIVYTRSNVPLGRRAHDVHEETHIMATNMGPLGLRDHERYRNRVVDSHTASLSDRDPADLVQLLDGRVAELVD